MPTGRSSRAQIKALETDGLLIDGEPERKIRVEMARERPGPRPQPGATRPYSARDGDLRSGDRLSGARPPREGGKSGSEGDGGRGRARGRGRGGDGEGERRNRGRGRGRDGESSGKGGEKREASAAADLAADVAAMNGSGLAAPAVEESSES